MGLRIGSVFRGEQGQGHNGLQEPELSWLRCRNNIPLPDGGSVVARQLWRRHVQVDKGMSAYNRARRRENESQLFAVAYRYEPVEGTAPSKRPLRCSGVADRARFEFVDGVADGGSAVTFKNTAMFQCRVHTFTVR